MSFAARLEAHFLLGHVEEARELLAALCDAAPAGYRESMVERVALHASIHGAGKGG